MVNASKKTKDLSFLFRMAGDLLFKREGESICLLCNGSVSVGKKKETLNIIKLFI